VRCPGCPRLTADGKTETLREEQLLNRVERLRRQRDSGRQITHLLGSLEWELLQIYDEQHDTYKREHEMRVGQLFDILKALLLRR
jgi:hypothetical protein